MKLKRVASFIPGEILENSKYSQQRDVWSGPLRKGVVSFLPAEFLQDKWTDKAAGSGSSHNQHINQ